MAAKIIHVLFRLVSHDCDGTILGGVEVKRGYFLGGVEIKSLVSHILSLLFTPS